MQTYTAKFKTRKQMESIPSDMRGWWFNICPGATLTNLRDATDEDLDRCNVKDRKNKKKEDFLCENIEHGSVINKIAIKDLRPNPEASAAAKPSDA